MFRRTPEGPAASADERPGFFRRLRARLNRGNSWLTYDLADLLRGRQIDAAILDELETRLITADVGVEASARILEELRKRVARKELADVHALIEALRSSIVEILKPCARPLVIDSARRPFVILVIGVNGSGKTTTIGKLARRCASEGKSVLLAAGDTFRAAAIEQLKVWAERSGAAFAAQVPGADPGAVVFDALQAAKARGSDVMLADTAGRLHSQSHLMEELKKVKRVLQRVDASAPHEVLLVLDANQGQNALAQARAVQRGGGRHRTCAHQARRHRQGRHRAGDRTDAQAAHPLHRRGRGARGLRGIRCRGLRRRPRRGAASGRGRCGGRRMIVFDRVSKRYANGREALTNVSFSIHNGEMVFLTGRSGAGKSTVLKLIALLERPTRGAVLVQGRNTQSLKARHIAAFRRGIGVVFQDHKLLADRPVYDNVALPLAVAATPLKEIDKRVRAALDQVGLLGKERALPLELSVGEQQRVGIARAVVSKPPLLIADEPTGNLDPDLSLEVMRLFRRFQDVGVTVVVATHDLHIVREFGERVITLENGALQGDPGDTLPSVVATR